MILFKAELIIDPRNSTKSQGNLKKNGQIDGLNQVVQKQLTNWNRIINSFSVSTVNVRVWATL